MCSKTRRRPSTSNVSTIKGTLPKLRPVSSRSTTVPVVLRPSRDAREFVHLHAPQHGQPEAHLDLPDAPIAVVAMRVGVMLLRERAAGQPAPRRSSEQLRAELETRGAQRTCKPPPAL
jgi:hypothetical protein